MKRRTLIVIAAALVLLVGLAVGYRFWSIQRALDYVASAPMGTYFGPASAENVLVELIDYRCDYCRRTAGDIEAFARAHPDVKIVIAHYPIFGQPSVTEAAMAMAAAKQGKFHAMHQLLVSREAAVEEADMPAIIAQLGLDAEKFNADRAAPDIGNALLGTLDAVKVLDIRGTPAFIVNGRIVPQEYMPNAQELEQLFHLNGDTLTPAGK